MKTRRRQPHKRGSWATVLALKGTDPARFTQFYDKVKNDPGSTVQTLPCTHFIQLEMPEELTATC